MRNGIALLLAAGAMLAAPAAQSAEPASLPRASLFFTANEMEAIEAANRQKDENPSGDIHLGAIIYSGPGDWIVWLQGERWTPVTTRDDLLIKDVQPDHVSLLWTPDTNAPPREITLHPYQTYQMETGQITEGKP